MKITPDQLRGILERAGISQGELARRLDINDRTVRRWCAGEVELKGPYAIAVRAVMDDTNIRRELALVEALALSRQVFKGHCTQARCLDALDTIVGILEGRV